MRETVSGAYDRAAPEYDRRWTAYTLRSLDLLRPYLTGSAERLLDVGCGTGALLRALDERGMTPGRYVGVDVSAGMLGVAWRRGIPGLLRASAEALPLRNASVSLVVSASSLHDWPDLTGALAEIRRVLEPGGRLLLLDWCADFLSIRLMRRWLWLTRRPVARVLRADELTAALRAAGFRTGAVHRERIDRVWGMMVAEAFAG